MANKIQPHPLDEEEGKQEKAKGEEKATEEKASSASKKSLHRKNIFCFCVCVLLHELNGRIIHR
uniref:hypothetical protein n=1 Tax=Aneurinibacillus tyrosinisolvens TaxID=1443435 RepID=UPI00063F68C3